MDVLKRTRNPLLWIFLISFIISATLFMIRLSQVGVSSSSQPLKMAFDSQGNVGVVMVEGVILDALPILKVLKEFEENEKIKSILVRLDSPGGAVGPSQEIYDQLLKMKSSKKIVASFGSVAASGAYYIACAAHKIVSSPGTLTGSIGVIMQLSNLEEFYKWIKIKPFVIKSGKHKDLGSSTRKMLPHERKLLQELMDNTHLQFQKAVAKGRGLPLDYVKTFADGRIMNGEIAKSFGLVDVLGNFDDAVDLAADLADISKPKLQYPDSDKWRNFKGMFGSSLGVLKAALQKWSFIPLDFRPAFLMDGAR